MQVNKQYVKNNIKYITDNPYANTFLYQLTKDDRLEIDSVHQSYVSESVYITVSFILPEELEADDETCGEIKIRVSDHCAKPTYDKIFGTPDIELSSDCNSNPQATNDIDEILKFIDKRYDKAIKLYMEEYL